MTKGAMENEYIKCWLEDNIMYAQFKPHTLDYTAAKECVALRLLLAAGNDYPTLIDGTIVQNVTKEARDYFASEDGTKGITASALLTNSVVGKFIGSFFLQINRPRIPVKIFNNKGDAVRWLQSLLK